MRRGGGEQRYRDTMIAKDELRGGRGGFHLVVIFRSESVLVQAVEEQPGARRKMSRPMDGGLARVQRDSLPGDDRMIQANHHRRLSTRGGYEECQGSKDGWQIVHGREL